MKETLMNMFFYLKKEYETFDNDLNEYLEGELTWKDLNPFWAPPRKEKPEENVITHKLKKD